MCSSREQATGRLEEPSQLEELLMCNGIWTT
uniref:Uncharacterized protein n=1 Tax=Anguilla anguilla TaxID=7936 RepID=A0A0E9USB6_ANGAN